MQTLLSLMALVFGFMLSASHALAVEGLPADFYEKQVQPIFDNRCIACHSCFNAPCQLNLQNFEGFSRGATKQNVYQGSRLKSVPPTRLWVDAKNTEDWHKLGFFSVNQSKEIEQNLFYKMLEARAKDPQRPVTKKVEESLYCPDSVTAMNTAEEEAPEAMSMPYGLPPLTTDEKNKISQWLQAGATGPVEKKISYKKETLKQIREWESFFNKSDIKNKLVSRYMYEHLFLAHIYFNSDKTRFFRLVRSRTACEKSVDEIATRRPNDDPGMKHFHYCLRPFEGTPVMKTHIPYEFSGKKLKRMKEIFFAEKWNAGKLPTYKLGVAENPFLAFHNIPVKSRYEFLLEDAQFHISTFIKGPVCNGSFAVNSIQEQFYVFFLDPSADNMVQSVEYEKSVETPLMLPGVWGSDIDITDTPTLMNKLRLHRETYRQLRAENWKTFRPEGYSLKDIWDGKGANSNAFLTVFRHDDNAVVLKGAVGDLSKTVFLLDYPLFERLVYNLVVNFDVFGNVGHQGLTRIYMDMIRMEAEELFLMFLPPEQRLNYRREWYRGLFAEAKMAYIFPTIGVGEPTAIRYTEETKTKKQFVEKVLFYRMNEAVRGSLDSINWRNIDVPIALQKNMKTDAVETELRKISSVKAKDSTPFSRFFPDMAYLMVTKNKEVSRVFSVIHNKEHENISWILGETLRMDPEDDSLTLKEGFHGPYPNQFFSVEEKDLAVFISAVIGVKSEKSYQKLVDKYGIRRSHAEFWSHYDKINRYFQEKDSIDFGYLDLTRYSLN